jgi:hypothetical protein
MKIRVLTKLAALFLALTAISASAQVSLSMVATNLPATGSSTALNYQIAILAASNGGTYDRLHLLVTVNSGWGSQNNTFIDATFSNRNGFTYQYTVRGAAVTSSARLVGYSNSDGSVSIYVNFAASTYAVGGFTVLENVQDAVYTNPTNVGATPSGTLVFDSSSSSYPPATYSDFSGNSSMAGNLTLKRAGSSIAFADGTVQSTAFIPANCGADYAESVDVTGDRTKYEPGDILVIDPNAPGKFLKSNQSYSTLVAGIYSTQPGFVGRLHPKGAETDKTEVPMAMVGRVPTKVTTENGPIKVGDLLVASSTLGHAMKGTDRSLLTGAVIGKALGSLDSGTGIIEVLVTLQ